MKTELPKAIMEQKCLLNQSDKVVSVICNSREDAEEVIAFLSALKRRQNYINELIKAADIALDRMIELRCEWSWMYGSISPGRQAEYDNLCSDIDRLRKAMEPKEPTDE